MKIRQNFLDSEKRKNFKKYAFSVLGYFSNCFGNASAILMGFNALEQIIRIPP